MKRIDNMKEMFENAVALCEASSFEKHMLWQLYSDKSDLQSKEYPIEKVEWGEVNQGWVLCIGDLNGNPVVVSFLMGWLYNQLVVFWYPTSSVVGYGLIDKYLNENFKNIIIKEDADNFFNILSALKENQ